MNIEDLEKCFIKAINENKKYVAVKIQKEGNKKPEIIINESDNFKDKLNYYKKAYNNDLTLKTYNKIKIIGFTSGDSFNYIEKNLIKE